MGDTREDSSVYMRGKAITIAGSANDLSRIGYCSEELIPEYTPYIVQKSTDTWVFHIPETHPLWNINCNYTQSDRRNLDRSRVWQRLVYTRWDMLHKLFDIK